MQGIISQVLFNEMAAPRPLEVSGANKRSTILTWYLHWILGPLQRILSYLWPSSRCFLASATPLEAILHSAMLAALDEQVGIKLSELALPLLAIVQTS